MTLTAWTLALAAFVLLGLGFVAVFVVGRLARNPSATAGLWPHLTQEAIVVGGFCLVFIAPVWVISLALILLGARIGYEAAMVSLGEPQAIGFAGFVGALAAFAFLPIGSGTGVAVAAGFWLLLFAAMKAPVAMLSEKQAAVGELMLFPVLPFSALVFLADAPGGPLLLLASYLLIETFDSYALLFGKSFGSHRIFPVLSPNKTTGGLIGGAIMLVLTAALAAAIFENVTLFIAMGFALLVGVGAVAGDLAASRLKRRAGVKDFPVILPRFGGALDHYDSWIAVGAALAMIFFAAGYGP